MGRAQRLTAAFVLACLVSAACDGFAQPSRAWLPTGASGQPGASPPGVPGATPYATIDALRPDPNAPAIHTRDARAPERLPGTTHDIDLVIDERHSTIAQGFVREVWAYSSTVPGPVIRVGLGDTIRIHLDNHPPTLPGAAAWQHPAVNSHPHSVVLDGSLVTSSDGTASIQPGETKVYEFKAVRAGVWLYHCATEPRLEHLANGEYGMVIVEPVGGFDAVAQEFFLVQGEWYVGGPRQSASMAKAAAANPVPDFTAFNGIAAQYVDDPIQIEAGKRVRVFILNAGPNLDTSFEIKGATVDRVIMDGLDLPVGGDGTRQPIDLSPGQGAILELTVAQDGYDTFLGQPSGVGRPGAVGLFLVRDDAAPR